MTDPIFADVTADDILDGQRCECSACPVALAAKRAWHDDVAVGTLAIDLLGVNGDSFAMTPGLCLWVIHFDMRLPVSPIRIKLHNGIAEIVS